MRGIGQNPVNPASIERFGRRLSPRWVSNLLPAVCDHGFFQRHLGEGGLSAWSGPRPAVFWATQWRLNPGDLVDAVMVSEPLTMIKGTLPNWFSSIRQTDRMSYGST
jgi:hypothetical protein